MVSWAKEEGSWRQESEQNIPSRSSSLLYVPLKKGNFTRLQLMQSDLFVSHFLDLQVRQIPFSKKVFLSYRQIFYGF